LNFSRGPSGFDNGEGGALAAVITLAAA
jgi:hypothetical protein